MNTIERIYHARGKQVHLQELADVAAVRAEPTVDRAPLTAAALQRIAPEEALPQVRALESAGWAFVPREEAADGAKVYLKPGGRVALGTNRLVVRVADKPSGAQAEDQLQRQGFTVVDRVGFAPNLFVVATPPGEDPITAAERLSASGTVEFAEPELIEAISGR